MATDAPILHQTVKWGENYVSRALNLKLGSILQPGIYRGFLVEPAGEMSVLITHAENEPRSIAVVDRDGYSITVILADAGIVKIPAPGIWHICIEALYAPNHPGYQRIVARAHAEIHHVVLATVTVPEGESVITADMISYDNRNFCESMTVLNERLQLMDIQNMSAIIALSDRLTIESLHRLEREATLNHELNILQNTSSQYQFREAALSEVLIQILERLNVLELNFIQHMEHNNAENDEWEKAALSRSLRENAQSGELIQGLDRITRLELQSHKENAGLSSMPIPMQAAGYTSAGGATVAPVSIIYPGANPPLGAAITLKFQEVEIPAK